MSIFGAANGSRTVESIFDALPLSKLLSHHDVAGFRLRIEDDERLPSLDLPHHMRNLLIQVVRLFAVVRAFARYVFLEQAAEGLRLQAVYGNFYSGHSMRAP